MLFFSTKREATLLLQWSGTTGVGMMPSPDWILSVHYNSW
jgi:hypothetical protein